MRRVHQMNGQRPWKELSGMRVARQLQGEASRFGERCELGIVGKQ
jgi:hypothetical protein